MNNRLIIFTALAIAGAVFFAAFIGYSLRADTQILEIRDSASGRMYGKWTLEEGSEFAIEFIHSVNMSPVTETFIIEKGMIRLAAMRFYSYGAGIPSYLDEGQTLTRDGNAMIISGFDSSLSELRLITGAVFDHVLYINEQLVSLQELCGKNTHITIRLK